MGDVLQITPTESVEIVSSDRDGLLAKATYAGLGAGGKPPPKHYHPAQDEQIEILVGTVRLVVDGEERTLGAGEKIEIPRGTVHSMWNASAEPAQTVWRTIPAGRTEQWFRAIDALRREGRVGKDGMPGPLAFGAYLTEYRDVFRLAGPDWLLRPALSALAAVGRRRGYLP